MLGFEKQNKEAGSWDGRGAGWTDADRLKTGIPRLDYILQGGFLLGGSYIIYGPPGAGKTLLGNQACFNTISTDDITKCLYVTVLTESIGKMIRHLRPQKFFNETAVAEQRLVYLSAFQELKENGTRGVFNLMKDAIAKQKPRVLVFDGFDSLKNYSKTTNDPVEFLYDLMTTTQLYDCTTLILATRGTDRRDESAVVDGVIELSMSLIGPRSIRELSVHKFRGGDFLAGKHEVEITNEGLQIHPRTEIQFDNPLPNANENRRRMKFGIDSLDSMLGGGPLSGSATALLGAPGTGKTFLGLSFLVEGAKQGHPATYFGFYEPPERLIEKAESIGLPLKKYVESGMIELLWKPPLEHFLDSLAEELLERYKSHKGNGGQRLFIDGLEGFRAANPYPDRMGRFLSAFLNQLRVHDVTTIISEELPLFGTEVSMPNPELGNVVESVVLLKLLELRSQIHRLISVLKMRESDYDTSIREFRITKNGLLVDKTFENAERLLSGHASDKGGPS